MRKVIFFMRLIILFLFVMMLSGCAYVTMSLTVGTSATMLVGGVMGARKIQKTQDSLKQVVADSLKKEYPAISSDSLSAMAENVIVSKTQDSIKQAVADSLKVVYPTVSPDSLPAMVETAIEEKEEAKRKAVLENIAGAFLAIAGVVAVVVLFVLPFGASPGLGD
jgi:hypothetical protein